MPRLIELEANKTYNTKENAIKAVEKVTFLGHGVENLRYVIHQGKDGRYFPVFIGMECLSYGVHFYFNVVG
jgi:hypothetical protein